jgi:hypothetical protein
MQSSQRLPPSSTSSEARQPAAPSTYVLAYKADYVAAAEELNVLTKES